ncbi:MAG: GNAT family N-acetyltransferase [Actinomycetota bacterium]
MEESRDLEPGGSEEEVTLREVTPADLDVFFEHQRDPEATAMAAFSARDKAAFTAHWNKILVNEIGTTRTIELGGRVAGNVVSWEQDGRRQVGYWIGKEHWGKGIATAALRRFLSHEPVRPLRAHVAKHNLGSIRVLEKCGFRKVGEETAPATESFPAIVEVLMELRG